MNIIKKKLKMQKDFASGAIIGWSGVHLDMISNRVLSVARESVAYHNSW